MAKKKRKQRHGTVDKVIKSDHSPEQAQIVIREAENLYREIRVENELTDGDGAKSHLTVGAEVDVIVEADSDATLASQRRQTKATSKSGRWAPPSTFET